MANKRMEGKLIDIVASGWNSAMPSPEQVQLAITEGVRLAMLEHLTGKPTPYLVTTNIPQFMQDALHKGELVPTGRQIAAAPPPNAPNPPRIAPPAAKPPASASASPAPATRPPAGRKATIQSTSLSDNAQRYLNVKFNNGTRLRFYLNSATQAPEWQTLLWKFAVEMCGVQVTEAGGWDSDELHGKELTLYGEVSTLSGLAGVAQALGIPSHDLNS